MADTIPLATPAERPWYRHRWPWLLMLGPFAVLLAGGYTFWLAFSRPDALVVGDYYTRGKAINQDLRRDRGATALALKAELGYDDAGAALTGRITSYDKPYTATMVLHLAHATLPQKDIKLTLKSDADGKFSMALPAFERTRWQVLLENTERDWRLDGAWTWPGQRTVALQADAKGPAAPAE